MDEFEEIIDILKKFVDLSIKIENGSFCKIEEITESFDINSEGNETDLQQISTIRIRTILNNLEIYKRINTKILDLLINLRNQLMHLNSEQTQEIADNYKKIKTIFKITKLATIKDKFNDKIIIEFFIESLLNIIENNLKRDDYKTKVLTFNLIINIIFDFSKERDYYGIIIEKVVRKCRRLLCVDSNLDIYGFTFQLAYYYFYIIKELFRNNILTYKNSTLFSLINDFGQHLKEFNVADNLVCLKPVVDEILSYIELKQLCL